MEALRRVAEAMRPHLRTGLRVPHVRTIVAALLVLGGSSAREACKEVGVSKHSAVTKLVVRCEDAVAAAAAQMASLSDDGTSAVRPCA